VAPGVGPIANANDDSEPGPGGPHVGDGYTAHDEYRGFHFLTPSNTPPGPPTIAWARTDANLVKDVFFWDESIYNIQKDLAKTLIGKHTSFEVREVNASQAQAISPLPSSSAQRWVDRLAKNSINRDANRAAYALVYHNQSIQGSKLGLSQRFNMTGVPILYDGLKIASEEIAFGVPSGILQAWVVAHEAGHQFSLSHTYRDECLPVCNYVGFPTMWTSSFGLDLYTIGSSNAQLMYVRAKSYSFAGQTFFEDRPVVSVNQVSSTPNSLTYSIQSNSSSPPLLPSVVEAPFASSIVPALSLVRVEKHTPSLMDWSFDFRFPNASTWQISTADLAKVCVHGAC
jgi:hypothetical protein